ncbi:tRNA lysidine(34) synthetase TilS [Peribacillus sp. NPDC096379]|uniref:tRNA lysidine(34) synthetase TilS n=1 Tax=Peribacillus sp. NPDC096379 TaxID=3364393 RepID=UPI00380C39E4
MFAQKVLSEIKRYQLIPQKSRLLVGVSGGPDSLVLLHFLCSLREKLELELVVAHVDHMFRGEESYVDYQFVEKTCQEWNIPFEGKRINVPAYMEQTGDSSQLAARNLRYAFFEEVMKKYQLSILALGHHGDDQIETMLMRLTRGASGMARAGIAVKRPFLNGEIIRPFLVVTKEEINAYANRYELTPRIDPSNEHNDYVRNRFRHDVLPALKRENPKVHEHFQRFSEELAEDEQLLQQMTNRYMEKIWLSKTKSESSIDLNQLLMIPKPLQRRAIQLILNYLYIKRPSSLSAVHIDQLSALFFNPHPSAELHLPEGLICEKSYETCTFRFQQKESSDYSVTITIPGETFLPNGFKIKAQYLEEISGQAGNHSFYLPIHKTTLPLIARNRRNGDNMVIKGKGNHTKKLKDIFINEKIPMQMRRNWPVLTDQSGVIVWIPGLKKSNLEFVDTYDEQSFIYLEYHKA